MERVAEGSRCASNVGEGGGGGVRNKRQGEVGTC